MADTPHPNMVRAQEVWDALAKGEMIGLDDQADDVIVENGPGAGPSRSLVRGPIPVLSRRPGTCVPPLAGADRRSVGHDHYGAAKCPAVSTPIATCTSLPPSTSTEPNSAWSRSLPPQPAIAACCGGRPHHQARHGAKGQGGQIKAAGHPVPQALRGPRGLFPPGRHWPLTSIGASLPSGRAWITAAWKLRSAGPNSAQR